jgi:O-antigen ligase
VTARVLRAPRRERVRPEWTAAALGSGAAGVAAAAAVAAGPAAFAIPVGVAAVLFLVRQPLALLTLFLYVGLFKQETVVQAMPIDATLGLGALLATVCFVRFASGRARRLPYGLALTLAVVGLALVGSLGWTPAPAYGTEKAEKFLSLTLLAAVAPFFLIEDESDLRRFFSWTVVIALAAAMLALVHPPPPGAERLELGAAANTIGSAQLLCTAAIVLLLGALAKRTWRLRATAMGVGLIVVATAVGSRGPLLALALALGVTAAVWVMRVPRKMVPLLLAVVAGLAVVPFVSLPETSGQRLAAAARDPIATFQENSRSFLYRQALELINEQPLRGVGAGGFNSVSPDKWPHNLFLELWSELGVVTTVVVAASIVAVLVGLYRTAWRLPEGPSRQLVYVVTGVFLFYLFAVQVSGDINENRAFWAVLGVAWLVVRDGVSPLRAAATETGPSRTTCQCVLSARHDGPT